MSTSEKAVVGSWSCISSDAALVYSFKNDRSFLYVAILKHSYSKFYNNIKGSWYESKGTIHMTNKQYQTSNNGETFTSWMPSSTPSDSMKIRHGSDERGQYFTDLKYGINFYKDK